MKKHSEDLWDFHSDKGEENYTQSTEISDTAEEKENTDELREVSDTASVKSEAELSFEQTNSIEGQDFIVAHRHRSHHSHSHHSHSRSGLRMFHFLNKYQTRFFHNEDHS